MLSALSDALLTQCSGRQDRNPKTTASIPAADLARHTVPSQDYPISYFSQILAASAEVNGVTDTGVTRNYQTKLQSWGRDYAALRRSFPGFGTSATVSAGRCDGKPEST
ncbi:hypothetical protein ACFUNF_04810 [Streptomyces sp. NPDC057291]|uniref:hypothetical protein n=1 Tax=Streptomyces sp. NPDC057291 TaxID=3346087 RepID=UPI0036286743